MAPNIYHHSFVNKKNINYEIKLNAHEIINDEGYDIQRWSGNGKIEKIGKSIKAAGVLVIDATDKWITPGIIDIHSHMGVYSAPGVSTSSDGNEATSPVTVAVPKESP